MESHGYSIVEMAAEHSAAVVDIFNYYIENEFSAGFEKPFSVGFFLKLQEIAEGYPAFVACDKAGEVAGFALLHEFHPGSALLRTAEVTYFLHPEQRGKGLGKLFLDRLVAGGLAMGIDNLVASISSLNSGSIAFHLKHGFVERGRLLAVGRKFGKDFDVIYMQRKIV